MHGYHNPEDIRLTNSAQVYDNDSIDGVAHGILRFNSVNTDSGTICDNMNKWHDLDIFDLINLIQELDNGTIDDIIHKASRITSVNMFFKWSVVDVFKIGSCNGMI